MRGLRSLSISLVGMLGCSVAPSGDTSSDSSSSDGSSSDESDATGGEDVDLGGAICTPQNAVEFELTAETLGGGVEVSACTVTVAERDPQDPTRWSFALECLHPVALELTLDPPLDVAPLGVGQEVTGIAGGGDVFEILELTDSTGRVILAVFDQLGPTDSMIDEPTAMDNPFTFEWSPEPNCTTMDETCGEVDQLRLDASAGDDVFTFDPSNRYGTVFEPPHYTYGVWVGDSWIGDCDGQPTRALRYAIVMLIPI